MEQNSFSHNKDKHVATSLSSDTSEDNIKENLLSSGGEMQPNSMVQEYNIENEKDFINIIRIFGLLLISPLTGWKAIRRHNISSDRWAQNCFYPIIAFSAASIFLTKFYNPYSSIEELLIPAVARFISYFFGYFLISILCQIFLPRSSKILTDSNFGKIFIMAVLSSLATFSALMSLLPMLEPVLVFLPLWSTYLIYKGVRFLKLPEQYHSKTVIILSILLIGIPYILNWSFNLIL